MKSASLFQMREMGLEPTRPCSHKNLNLARLPIPTLPRMSVQLRRKRLRKSPILLSNLQKRQPPLLQIFGLYRVQKMGLEPTRHCCHRHLKPARLPIPPLLQARCIIPYTTPSCQPVFPKSCSEYLRCCQIFQNMFSCQAIVCYRNAISS